MNINLESQQKLCQSAKQIITIAKKHNITDLWVIPPVTGFIDKRGQVDLMFTYSEDRIPSLIDIVEMSVEIEEAFRFDFKIEWHDMNNIIAAASKTSEKPYYVIFLEAINSAIPLDRIEPNISLSEQLQKSNELSSELPGYGNRVDACLFQFQKMNLGSYETQDYNIVQREKKDDYTLSMS